MDVLQDVLAQLKRGELASAYVVAGEESYLAGRFLEALRRRVGSEADWIECDLSRQSVEDVLYELDTPSLFSERKVVIAKGAEFLKAAERGKEKIDFPVKRFERWLADPPGDVIAVFLAPYPKLDERKKIVKLLNEAAVVVRAVAPEGREVDDWIIAQALDCGRRIDRPSARHLRERAGADLQQLQKEVEKLAAYVEPGEAIGIEAIDALVPRSLDGDIFSLAGHLLAGNRPASLALYRDLLALKEDPLKINALLASHVRLLLLIGHLKGKGYSAQQMAAQLKVHPYRIKVLLDEVGRVPTAQQQELLHALAEADFQLKSSSLPREMVLELLLLA